MNTGLIVVKDKDGKVVASIGLTMNESPIEGTSTSVGYGYTIHIESGDEEEVYRPEKGNHA